MRHGGNMPESEVSYLPKGTATGEVPYGTVNVVSASADGQKATKPVQIRPSSP